MLDAHVEHDLNYMGFLYPTAILAFFGNAVVFFAYWRYEELRKAAINRLVLFMCIADQIWVAFALLGQPALMDAGGPFCTFQGFCLSTAAIADTLWTITIGAWVTHVHLRLKSEKSFLRLMPLWHALCWGVPLAVNLSLFALTDPFDVSGAWCWIAPQHEAVRWLAFLGLETATPFFAAAVFAAVKCERRRRAAEADGAGAAFADKVGGKGSDAVVTTMSPLEILQARARPSSTRDLELGSPKTDLLGGRPHRDSSAAPVGVEGSTHRDPGLDRALVYLLSVAVVVTVKQVHRVLDIVDPTSSAQGSLTVLMTLLLPLKYGFVNSMIFSSEVVVADGTLAAFLNLPGGTATLAAFVRREHSEENLEFLLCLHALRTGDTRMLEVAAAALAEGKAEAAGLGSFGALSRASGAGASGGAGGAGTAGGSLGGAKLSAASTSAPAGAGGAASGSPASGPGSAGPAAARVTAEAIRDIFVLEGAPKQVNLPHTIRASVIASLEDLPSAAAAPPSAGAAHAFQAAEEELLLLVERDTFRRFARCKEYKRFLRRVSAESAIPRGRAVATDLLLLMVDGARQCTGRAGAADAHARMRSTTRSRAASAVAPKITSLNGVQIFYR